jgi:hypothetical protein
MKVSHAVEGLLISGLFINFPHMKLHDVLLPFYCAGETWH